MAKLIAIAVSSLDHLDDIVPAVQDLGRRHLAYGVRPKDYMTVGGALLSTLEAGLGPAFTSDVKEAWTTAYGILSQAMLAAAEEAAA